MFALLALFFFSFFLLASDIVDYIYFFFVVSVNVNITNVVEGK